MPMQLELRRHPTEFFDVDRISGTKRGPLEPDDSKYPVAFKSMRAIWIDGTLVGYCNLAPNGPINLLPSLSRVLPQLTDTERQVIAEFVDSHREGAAAGRLVDPIRPIPAEGAGLDEDEEDEDDDE